MSIMTIGIDLAKNVFAVNGVDENGKAALIKPNVAQSTGALRFVLLAKINAKPTPISAARQNRLAKGKPENHSCPGCPALKANLKSRLPCNPHG